MNIAAAVRAETKFALPRQPRKSSLHHPAEFSQPAAVRSVPARDPRADAAPTQSPPVRFRVVCPVRVQDIRSATRPPRLAADRRNRIDQRFQLRHVVGVRRGHGRRQRRPSSVHDHVVFAPFFTAVDGARAGFLAPSDRPQRTAVDGRPLPVDEVGPLEVREESGMQLPACAGMMQISQQPPTGHAAAALHFARGNSEGMPVLRTNGMPVRAWRW